VSDNSQEDFVVDDGVENSSTVSLIQLKEATVKHGILTLDTQKGLGPDGISPLILKEIVLIVKKSLAVLFNLSLLLGFFHASARSCTLRFRTIVEYLFYRRLLSFLIS
jgi:hypothetical protein